jgi:NIPSNAP protein
MPRVSRDHIFVTQDMARHHQRRLRVPSRRVISRRCWREQFSPLAACWTSELGGLNRFVHTWVYKDLNERARVREASRKPGGQWPPQTGVRPRDRRAAPAHSQALGALDASGSLRGRGVAGERRSASPGRVRTGLERSAGAYHRPGAGGSGARGGAAPRSSVVLADHHGWCQLSGWYYPPLF